jgi:hypothetical protein
MEREEGCRRSEIRTSKSLSNQRSRVGRWITRWRRRFMSAPHTHRGEDSKKPTGSSQDSSLAPLKGEYTKLGVQYAICSGGPWIESRQSYHLFADEPWQTEQEGPGSRWLRFARLSSVCNLSLLTDTAFVSGPPSASSSTLCIKRSTQSGSKRSK